MLLDILCIGVTFGRRISFWGFKKNNNLNFIFIFILKQKHHYLKVYLVIF